MPHPFIPTTQLYIPHVSHHHLKRAPRAQPMPPPAPQTRKLATQPHRHVTECERQWNDATGPQVSSPPLRKSPRMSHTPSRMPHHGQVSPPTLESPPPRTSHTISPRVPHCGLTQAQVSPPSLENRLSPYPPSSRARDLCGRVCSIVDVQGGGEDLQLHSAGKGLLRSCPYFPPLL